MVDEAAGAHDEAEQAAVAVDFLDAVKYTRDDVVSAGGLASAEDDADVEGLAVEGAGDILEVELGQTVGGGEELPDVLLVGYRLGGFAGNGLHCALEGYGEFGLISSAGFLQCAFFHCMY